MKIALLNITSKRKECVIKDFMGGYGWAFNAGNSLPARMINFVKRKGEKIPLLSFGYLNAIFTQNGHNVSVECDTIPKSADIVIISSSMVDYKNEIEWAKRIKAESRACVGFIGPFAGAKPELFLEFCDFVIKGEPEQAAYDIAGGLTPKGLLISNHIDDLNSLPFPNWDNFAIREYGYRPALKERPFLPILSSRGCSFRCNYCPYLVDYKWRVRNPENVVDEIEYLYRRYHIRGMLFRDPLFGLKREQALGIARGMLKRGVKIRWACETRLDLLEEGLIDVLYKAGLRVINVGIESSSEDVLKKATRKPIDIEHQERIVGYCDKKGIRVTVFYIFGLPADTRETIESTIRYAKKINTHVAQFFIMTPFPGTEYFETVKDNLIEKDWEHFDCYTPVVKHPNLTREDILRLKEKAFVSYYYRPRWAWRFLQRAGRDFLN